MLSCSQGVLGMGSRKGAKIRAIRVRVLEDRTAVDLKARGRCELRDLSTGRAITKPGGDALTFRAGKKTITLNGKNTGSKSILVRPERSLGIILGKDPVRGALRINLDRNGTLSAVNLLNIEEYCLGVVGPEIGPGAPFEAMKAQAVIARTYALYQMGIREKAAFDVSSDHRSQNYGGVRKESGPIERAVRETRGEYLVYKGRVLPSFYCTCCGGHTEKIQNVWKYPYRFPKTVRCGNCRGTAHYTWESTVTGREIAEKMRKAGYPVGELLRFGIRSRDRRTGKVKSVLVVGTDGSWVIQAGRFRMAMGSRTIKSTDFTVKTGRDKVYFTGKGFGHGVGLCQAGAIRMAEDGADYEKILKKYYPGTKIWKLY